MKILEYMVQYSFMAATLFMSMELLAQPEEDIVEIKKIWDKAGHNAFTDITFFKGKFYVVFREGDGHIPNEDNTGNGKIRILTSTDTEYWESAGVLELKGIDLRDPKISVTPKNRLMILYGGSEYDHRELKGYNPYVSFSDAAGKKFSDPEPVELDERIKTGHDWLWRVTWYDKVGYGVVYQSQENDGKKQFKAYLVKTTKGVEYELITELELDGSPTEATVRFLSGAEMMIVMRRDGGDKMGMIGTSKAPYTDWSWEKMDYRLGGPDFEVIPINKILIGTRIYGEDGAYTALLLGKKGEKFREVMRFPSGGDTSYPGMYSIGGYVWFTYYSSHEGKASIYYTRIPLSKLK